jgi:hypothetical protein
MDYDRPEGMRRRETDARFDERDSQTRPFKRTFVWLSQESTGRILTFGFVCMFQAGIAESRLNIGF